MKRPTFLLALFLWAGFILPLTGSSQSAWKEICASSQADQNTSISAAIVMQDGRLACAGKTDNTGALLIIDPVTGKIAGTRVFSEFHNSYFSALTEDASGNLILVGGTEKNTRPLVVRYAPNGQKTSVDATRCRPRELQKVARLSNGKILAAALEGDSLMVYEIKQKVEPLFSLDARECADFRAMVSDPSTGGIWLCGNTRKYKGVRKNDAWLYFIDKESMPDSSTSYTSQNKQEHAFSHLGTERYEEVLAVSSAPDGTLSICGKTMGTEENFATWFGWVPPNKGPKNQLIAKEISNTGCFGYSVCKTYDQSYYVFVHQPDANGALLEMQSAPSLSGKYTVTSIPENFIPTDLLETPHGDLVLVGNADGKIKFFQHNRQKPLVKTSARNLLFGAPVITAKGNNNSADRGGLSCLSVPVFNTGKEDTGPLDIWVTMEPAVAVPGFSVISDTIYRFPIRKNDSITVPVYVYDENPAARNPVRLFFYISANGFLIKDTVITIDYADFSDNRASLISITSHEKYSKTTDKSAAITFTIKTPIKKNDLNKIKVFYNKKTPISVSRNDVKDNIEGFQCLAKVNLVEGDNLITFIYASKDTQEIIIRRNRRPQKLFAFAVGVDDSGITMSNNSARQFAALQQEWRSSGFFTDVTVYDTLIRDPSAATAQNIKSMLLKIRDDMVADSIRNDPADYFFYFFFCGHGKVTRYLGRAELYLLTVGYEENQGILSLKYTDILSCVMDNMPGKKFLFLDVCRKKQDGIDGLHWDSDDRFPGETATFFSCAPGDISYEPNNGTSQITIFTEALLNAFKPDKNFCQPDNNCIINVEKLDNYLQNEVHELLPQRRTEDARSINQVPKLETSIGYKKSTVIYQRHE